MSTDKQRARQLERKILKAIESGEFVPDFGYLHELRSYDGTCEQDVFIGPCGCAIAAAASVSGLKGNSSHDGIHDFMADLGYGNLEMGALENGYEDQVMYQPDDILEGDVTTGPFFEVGKRLRRFHPAYQGRVQ